MSKGFRTAVAERVAAPDKDTPSLPAADAKALKALAAYQLRYGMAEEAIALLLVARRLWPNDAGVLPPLAQALLQAGRTEQARIILDEFARRDAQKAQSGPGLLLRAVTLLRQANPTEARRLFAQFLNLRRQRAP